MNRIQRYLEKDDEEEEHNYKLNSSWNIWYHHEKNNWSISGYKQIYKIDNAIDFWKMYNNWNSI